MTLKTMLVERHHHHEDCVRFVLHAHRRRAYRPRVIDANTFVAVVALWGD
jgi:hypothetical protein